MLTTLLATIFVLGVLVFVHETGHFLAAKAFKIKVERFSLGFPPKLYGKTIGETEYCISWVPLGGYVKIAGMVDESFDTKQLAESPKPWEYRSKPWIQRFLVIVAGPLMNLVLSYFVFTGGIWIQGASEPAKGTVVGEVSTGNPAATAGIRQGDKIRTVDAKPVETWEAMAGVIHAAPGREITVEWMRGDSLLSAWITPQAAKDESGAPIGLIGIGPEIVTRPVGFFEAVRRGGETLYYWCRVVVVSVAKLVTGRESVKSLAGPVLIAKMAGESARSGFASLMGFLALISLNLGLINLLPIPALDGGHLTYLVVEGVIRRELPVKTKMTIQQIGVALIITLTLFVIYNDIVRVMHH